MGRCRGPQDQPWAGHAVLRSATHPVLRVPLTPAPRLWPAPHCLACILVLSISLPCPLLSGWPSVPASSWNEWNHSSLQGFFCFTVICNEDRYCNLKLSALSSGGPRTCGRNSTSLLQGATQESALALLRHWNCSLYWLTLSEVLLEHQVGGLLNKTTPKVRMGSGSPRHFINLYFFLWPEKFQICTQT